MVHSLRIFVQCRDDQQRNMAGIKENCGRLALCIMAMEDKEITF